MLRALRRRVRCSRARRGCAHVLWGGARAAAQGRAGAFRGALSRLGWWHVAGVAQTCAVRTLFGVLDCGTHSSPQWWWRVADPAVGIAADSAAIARHVETVAGECGVGHVAAAVRESARLRVITRGRRVVVPALREWSSSEARTTRSR